MPKHIAIAYIDLLTCLFALFLAFFVIMSDDQSKGNIQDPSLFLATIEWSKDSRSDVDLFMQAPNGERVNFMHQDSETMSLDMDDKGLKPVDVVRREVVSVKKLLPGKYTVNALTYAARDNGAIAVKASVLKLKGFGIVCEDAFQLTQTGEEHTICSFTVDEGGSVLNVDKGQRSLVK